MIDDLTQMARSSRSSIRDHRSSIDFAWFLARLLDEAVRVPGTRIPIGLDPLIGLIPGIGDALAALGGAWIVLIGAQLGLPRIALVRMALNLSLNAAIGGIPGLGDLFSFWYRSNLRNAALIERHASDGRRASTAGDWLFVIGLLAAVLLVIAAVLAAIVWAVARLWRAMA
jgi:hypothetical protein